MNTTALQLQFFPVTFRFFLPPISQHHLSHHHHHHHPPDHVALEGWRAASVRPDLRRHCLPPGQLLSKWLRRRRLALPLQPGMARGHLLRGWDQWWHTSHICNYIFNITFKRPTEPGIIIGSIFSGAGELSQVLWIFSHDLWTLEELLPDISDHRGVQGMPFALVCGKGGTIVCLFFLLLFRLKVTTACCCTVARTNTVVATLPHWLWCEGSCTTGEPHGCDELVKKDAWIKQVQSVVPESLF